MEIKRMYVRIKFKKFYLPMRMIAIMISYRIIHDIFISSFILSRKINLQMLFTVLCNLDRKKKEKKIQLKKKNKQKKRKKTLLKETFRRNELLKENDFILHSRLSLFLFISPKHRRRFRSL